MKNPVDKNTNNSPANDFATDVTCMGLLDLGLTRRLATLLSPVVITVLIISDPGGVR